MTRVLCWALFVLFMSTLTNSSPVGANRVSTRGPALAAADSQSLPPPVIREILLSAVGDCTIGSDESFGYAETLPAVLQENRDYSYFFKNVIHILGNDDITVANLETALTNARTKADKQFRFKGPPEYARALVDGSVEAVNLANNHTWDYLEDGWRETRGALGQYGIGYFGEEHAWVTEVQGQKFAFLGYFGFHYDDGLVRQMARDIARLKKEGCTVVTSFHWGAENSYYPDRVQTALARQAIDHGADLVLGHHPHVMQGVEVYKGRFICYSLGNFCFGGNANPRDKDTFITQVRFVFHDGRLVSCGLRTIPCSISSVSHKNDYRPTPLSGREKERVQGKLNGLAITPHLELGDRFLWLHQDL